MPASSQQRLSNLPRNLTQKEGWECSRHVWAFTLGKASPVWTHQGSGQEHVPHHCRVDSGCLFPLSTQRGSWIPGCGGRLSTMQQSSDCSFRDKRRREMRKGLSCKALFPLYFGGSYNRYMYPGCTFRLQHVRTKALCLASFFPFCLFSDPND